MSDSNVHDEHAPLPRPTRERRRPRADRGLPPDEELRRLATDYLVTQRKNWPKLAGLLPDSTTEVLTDMVEDFKQRHRTGQVDPEPLKVFMRFGTKLAGNYDRYSCENSNPKSISDQMVNSLEKARQEERFVPWQYIFADYSVSGLNPSRQGYTSYKAVLQDTLHFIETTYIDDFSRASRDEVEWWRLAYLSRRLQKRMIGASDGFDLIGPNWDMTMTVFGLLSRLFIKGLREKVRRGMRGAVRRGTCVGKLPLGFTRTVKRDKDGNVVRDNDGIPIKVPCKDAATSEFRKLLYELFVVKCWSVYQITKHFNSLRVDGWSGWTEAGIKKLLRSPSAIGVFIWNRTRREYDREEERWIVIQNPRREWVVFHDPKLAIVSIDLWKSARKKLDAMRRQSPLTGRKMSRNEKSASTLFSGTLFCGYCGRELTLARSAGKYKVFGCMDGPAGRHDCKLTTSKSTRIIEKSLLRFLKDRLLTEEAITELVSKANAYLAEDAKKPRVDTAPLKLRLRDKSKAIKKFFDLIEDCDDAALLQAYGKRVAELQKEVNELTKQLREIETRNEPTPRQLDRDRLIAMLDDLDGLLNQEVPAAAEAIRNLTGRIAINQMKSAGKRGATWIAAFSPDLLGWLRSVAADRDCPDSVTLEFLSSRIWITPEKIELAIDHVPKYERLSGEVAALDAKGASVTTIASVLGVTWELAKQALEYAKTGRRPAAKPPGRRTGRGDPRRKNLDVAEIVRLRDEKRDSFRKIAKRFGVSVATVTRAYDRGKPTVVNEAASTGKSPNRGRYSHLPQEVFDQIRARLKARESVATIAADIGCGTSTVYRVKKSISTD